MISPLDIDDDKRASIPSAEAIACKYETTIEAHEDMGADRDRTEICLVEAESTARC